LSLDLAKVPHCILLDLECFYKILEELIFFFMLVIFFFRSTKGIIDLQNPEKKEELDQEEAI
jgi:hypothetical protein